jgi:hypothetical protein
LSISVSYKGYNSGYHADLTIMTYPGWPLAFYGMQKCLQGFIRLQAVAIMAAEDEVFIEISPSMYFGVNVIP